MPSYFARSSRSRLLVPGSCLVLLLACSDDAISSSERPQRASAEPDPQERPALYAMTNEIYSDEDSTTYVNVLDTLDIDGLDTSRALEYGGGRATIGSVNGWLFVAEPGAPVITRFVVAAGGSVSKKGSISFANFGFEAAEIDDWGNTFISATKAYLWSEGVTVVWNPTTLEIESEIETDKLDFEREGWSLSSSASVLRGNRLFRTVYWSNWDEFTSSKDQYLLVYDTDRDEIVDVVEETRCPALSNRIDRDEEGNLYFSNWIWNVGETLAGEGPSSCALRILAGEETFDRDWILRYPEITAGREGAMFSYLGAGKALISVFYEDHLDLPADTAPDELVSTDSWKLWLIDLDSREGAPLEGLPWNAGAISTYHVDDRAFLLVPGDDWTSTSVHEVVGEHAEKRFDAKGWSYQLFKLE
jgi:hypothetical protein